MTYDEIKTKLSPGEWQVFTLLGFGKRNVDIAVTLEISEGDVSTNIRRICKKLGLGNSREVVVLSANTQLRLCIMLEKCIKDLERLI